MFDDDRVVTESNCLNPARRLGHWAGHLLLILCLIVFTTNTMAQSAASIGEYTLGAGDRLRVLVHESPDLSGEFLVSGQGLVSLPLIGDVQAGGKTVRELAESIADKLMPDYLRNPRVSVEVLNFRPFDIIGEVNKPGSYPFRHGMTILNAVAMAGGFTYRANKSSMLIRRAKDPEGREQEATEETMVMPGDVIRVKERFF